LTRNLGDSLLDVIEKAIRNAFEKGNADDRAFRERVYRSAFAALERALQGNAAISPETAAKRRKDLQAKIAGIETEFIPAVPPARPAATPSAVTQSFETAIDQAPAVELDGEDSPSATRDMAPALDSSGPTGARTVEPSLDIPDTAPRAPKAPKPVADAVPSRPVPEPFFADASDFGTTGSPLDDPAPAAAEVSAADGPNVVIERRRPITALFLGVTLMAVAAIGIWWGISTGLIKLPSEPEENDIIQPPPDDETFVPGEEEAPAKPGEADARRDWILVFNPSDPTTVNAPGDTKAETMTDDSGDFLRIRSGASGSTIAFDVAQGVLEQVAGKHAVFDIVARAAEEGKSTQISVDCNFGELGDCGRKRYEVGYEKGEFLFDIELPDKAPGAEGTIAINSDIDNGGKAVDIYEIKVSVGE
jgi:hypothetical protein